MPKKKEIKVRRGYVKRLADECNTNRTTVWNALRWAADTDKQREVREAAKKYLREF